MDNGLDRLLRQSMSRTPPPEPSAAFDRQVLARVRRGRERRGERWLRAYWICTGVAAVGIVAYVSAAALPPESGLVSIPASFGAAVLVPRWLRRLGALG